MARNGWMMYIDCFVRRAGTAALVSFIFGASVEAGSVQQPLVAAAAMGCLLLGIALITWSGRWQQTAAAQHAAIASVPAISENNRLADSRGPGDEVSGLEAPLLGAAPQPSCTSPPPAAVAGGSRQQWLGAGFAVITGLMGGLVLAPMDFVLYECQGLPYISGLAAGVAAAAPVVTYLVDWLTTHKVRVRRQCVSCFRVLLELASGLGMVVSIGREPSFLLV